VLFPSLPRCGVECGEQRLGIRIDGADVERGLAGRLRVVKTPPTLFGSAAPIKKN
jgi:hypothetical protein